MKNNTVINAVIPGVIALAAIVLSFRYLASADSILGFAGVVAILGIAALEYRLSWKRVFGRN